jgi:hypothetical protein
MLNWEQDRRRTTPKGHCPDALPDTGSKADMWRWAKMNSVKTNTPSSRYRNQGDRPFKPINNAIQQLDLYVKCIQSQYFYEKPLDHRREVIACIRKLIARVNTDPRTSSAYARDLVAQAQSLIANINAH